MSRRTKAARRAAFRRSWRRALMTATMAPIEGRPGPWGEARTAEWVAALDVVDGLLHRQAVTVDADERARAVKA